MKKSIIFLISTVSLFLQIPFALADYVRPGSECPAVDNASFCYRGGEFKFVGINLQAIAHLDKIWKDENPAAEKIIDEWKEQLTAARNMGVSVIRIFAPHKDKPPQEAKASVLNFMNTASQIYGGQEIKFIINLTDFYNNPNGATTEQDDAYEEGLLRPSWFITGGAQPNYEVNYKNFLKDFITHPLTVDTRIFAWQLGNEIQAGRGDQNTGVRERMLQFAYTMGRYIKNTLGARQMVTTGFIGANHAVAGDHAGWIDNSVCQIYHYWEPGKTSCNTVSDSKNSPFDFVYIHGYNNEWSDPPCSNCAFPHQWQEVDINWANEKGRPYVIGEFAFNGAYTGSHCNDGSFPGGTWGNIELPEAGNNRARKPDGGDGVTAIAMNHFFNALSADGILHWGFMASLPEYQHTWNDNKLGDGCSGMDSGLFYKDWPEMEALFHFWSAQLPKGGNIEITGTVNVPASGTTVQTNKVDNDPQTKDFTLNDANIPEGGGTIEYLAEGEAEIIGESTIEGSTVIGTVGN